MTGWLFADVCFGVVDVRNVADLHLRAITNPQTAGQRFTGVAGPSLALADGADILRSHLGLAASRVPTRKLPNWQVWLPGWRSLPGR